MHDVPDTVWNALIAAVVTIVLGWLHERAAQRAEQVRLDLIKSAAVTDHKLEDIAATGKAVHTLVNSSMSAQLKVAMIALQRIAHLTKDPEDIAAAEAAEKLYKEHDAKQQILDDSIAREKKG